MTEYPRSQWWQFAVEDEKLQGELEALRSQYDDSKKLLEARFMDKVEKVQRGDEMPPGVMKMVKVFVAVKRKIQPGDKMAGRHGNKGVVSRILPVEDMPFLEDGTHADIVLNPLGVPSRMNVGQMAGRHGNKGVVSRILPVEDMPFLEDGTHADIVLNPLGVRSRMNVGQVLWKPTSAGLAQAWARRSVSSSMFIAKRPISSRCARRWSTSIRTTTAMNRSGSYDDDPVLMLANQVKRGVSIATPVFDGAVEADINAMLTDAGLATSGQSTLYDGRTGEPFDRQVTMGYIYMLKLHHLVDDKIHARSIGPYSLVTQQPLGGKAQFGGQRFGEMEVWALEAYGAAYTLQEMLTVKSDDVAGRTKVYEAIVRGDDTFEAGIPESFNVLVKEMRSLGLNVELDDTRDAEQPALPDAAE